MSSVDLRLVKRALISIGAAALILCAFFIVFLGGVLLGDRDKPQFPYELVLAAAGAIYFGALSTHSWRGLKKVLNESEVARTIRFLAQSVLGMFVPVAAAAAFMLWMLFQPAY